MRSFVCNNCNFCVIYKRVIHERTVNARSSKSLLVYCAWLRFADGSACRLHTKVRIKSDRIREPPSVSVYRRMDAQVLRVVDTRQCFTI